MTDNHTIYSGKMKAADLISADWRLLSIFERLDIKLGFGEATIDEICSRYNLSTELFLMICNIYSFNSYRPKAEKLKKEDLPHILSYLRASHKHYMNNWFPRLHNNIHTMMEEYEDTNSYVLNKFFDDYDTEVKKHFEYEEFSVFPYIESLLDGSSEAVYKISNFEDNHTNVEEKLNDLKNIIIKYLPGTLHFEHTHEGAQRDIQDRERPAQTHIGREQTAHSVGNKIGEEQWPRIRDIEYCL